MSELKTNLPNIQIRKSRPSDIDDVTAIENLQFTNPWKKNYFSDELTHELSFFYVAEEISSKRVVGYIIFWIIQEMLELHKIAVSPDFTGKGIGKLLFLFMVETAKTKGVDDLFLEVRKSNTAAIKLYESCNFKNISVRKGYYSDPTEDALIYRLQLSSH